MTSIAASVGKSQAHPAWICPVTEGVSDYGEHSLNEAVKAGTITPDDALLIRRFIIEQRGQNHIGTARAQKIVRILTRWRRFIGPYGQNTMEDLYLGVEQLNRATYVKCSPWQGKEATAPNSHPRPYSDNTRRDYVHNLKRFCLWMEENHLTRMEEKRLKRLKPPPENTGTVTVGDILTKQEIHAILQACRSSRDRALWGTCYEGGLRAGEVITLTWGQVVFDDIGAALTINFKTGKPRYVRMVEFAGYLSQWKHDYPAAITPASPVFLTPRRTPLTHAALEKQLRILATRAGVTKHIYPHLIRHSRITHMREEGYSDAVVSLEMWGTSWSKMLPRYSHLSSQTIDEALLAHNGVQRPRAQKHPAPQHCPHCHTTNESFARYCSRCGRALTTEEAITYEELVRRVEAHPVYADLSEKVKTLLPDREVVS